MNGYDERLLQSFRRTKGFFGERGVLITATGTGPQPALAQQVTAFGVALDAIEAAAADQETAVRTRRGATADARILRRALFHGHFAPIARVSLSAIPDVVKMEEALRMPQSRINRERTLAVAEAMAMAGEQYKAVLVAKGLPADFVEQLRTAADAYKAAIDAQGQAVGSRRGATERLRQAKSAGRRTRNAITALLKRELAADPAALAEFKQLTRVTLRRVRGSAGAAAVAGAAPEAITTA